MGDEILLQRHQGVAVARGRRVLRNPERVADLRERELVPDLHDQHLALLDWKTIDRGSQLFLRSIVEIKLRLSGLLHLESCVGFAACTARIAPDEIERDRTDSSEEQSAIVDRMFFAPETNESVLHDVLGVRQLPHELAGEEDKPWRKFRETNFPIFMSDDILQDLFTVF